MISHLYALQDRVQVRLQRIGRQVAVASGAGALILTGLSLLGAAGLVWLSARYGVLIALSAAGGVLVVLGLLVFLIGKPRPAKAVAEAAPIAEEVAVDAVMPGGDLVHTAGEALRTARSVLPPGAGAAVAGAVTTQIARRPGKALATAVALGAIVGLVHGVRPSLSRRVPRD